MPPCSWLMVFVRRRMPQPVVSFVFPYSDRQRCADSRSSLFPVVGWLLSVSWLSHGRSRSSCHVRSYCRVASEGKVTMHFWPRVGVCLVAQIHQSHCTGTKQVAYVHHKRGSSLLPPAMALVLGGMLLHGAPDFALEMHACMVSVDQRLEHR